MKTYLLYYLEKVGQKEVKHNIAIKRCKCPTRTKAWREAASERKDFVELTPPEGATHIRLHTGQWFKVERTTIYYWVGSWVIYRQGVKPCDVGLTRF